MNSEAHMNENENIIGSDMGKDARSVLLIDGRGVADAPMDCWTDLLTFAYSKTAPIDDGMRHLDIDMFIDCFDMHEGVAFPTVDIYDSNDGSCVDITVLIEPWRIDELDDDEYEAVSEYCSNHGIAIDLE